MLMGRLKKEGKKSVMRRRNQGEKSDRWISGAQIVLRKQKASKILPLFHVKKTTWPSK